MTHQFSVEIQQYISDRIKEITEKMKKAEHQKDVDTTEYCKGQLIELIEIREYLSTKVDLNTQSYF
ncbi:MAG: hypothetical protein MJE63_11490 [Proteobacteria bacterium]|nr:hypothetical protein [Pseudomonadota bacterium]